MHAPSVHQFKLYLSHAVVDLYHEVIRLDHFRDYSRRTASEDKNCLLNFLRIYRRDRSQTAEQQLARKASVEQSKKSRSSLFSEGLRKHRNAPDGIPAARVPARAQSLCEVEVLRSSNATSIQPQQSLDRSSQASRVCSTSSSCPPVS